MYYLEHHGILGQKWGVRRFQNSDGTLTSAGKSRYNVSSNNAKNAYKETKEKESKAGRKAFKASWKNWIDTEIQRTDKANAIREDNALRVQKLQDKHTYKIAKMKEKGASEEKIKKRFINMNVKKRK